MAKKEKENEKATDKSEPEPKGTAVPTRTLPLILLIGFGFIIVIIALRIAMLLTNANDQNIFVNLIYVISGILVAPFFWIFGYTPTFGAPVFELGAIIAIPIYVLLCWYLVDLLVFGRRAHRVVKAAKNQ